MLDEQSPEDAIRRETAEETEHQIGSTIIDAKTIMLLPWAALQGPFARA